MPSHIKPWGIETLFSRHRSNSSPSSEGAQAKLPRCVSIDSPDAWRHHSVTAFIPVAFILIWIISLLVSGHHGSFPFSQSFKQEAEDIQDRAQSTNAKNTKITWQVTDIFWTFCRTDAQMQLLQFAKEEELDAWAPKAVDSCHVWPYSRGSYKLYLVGLMQGLYHASYAWTCRKHEVQRKTHSCWRMPPGHQKEGRWL